VKASIASPSRSRRYAQLAQGFWRPTLTPTLSLTGRGRPEGPGEGLQVLQREYDRLFAHRTEILCPIYEAEYDRHRALTQGTTLADIAGFYRAFGLEVATSERPDHLALELEFMGALTYKEALALESGRLEETELCRDAQRKFLEAHLGRWVGLFAESVLQQSQNDFYLRLAAELREFITVECRSLGAQPQLAQRFEEEPEIPIDCPIAR
jgi:TorA maturation chaperone TorD